MGEGKMRLFRRMSASIERKYYSKVVWKFLREKNTRSVLVDFEIYCNVFRALFLRVRSGLLIGIGI